MPEFECRLKKYRQLKELTQEQLAAKVGVRRETIMRLEKAQYNPSLKLAIDISRAVGAPIEEIFLFPETSEKEEQGGDG
ncbi:helix-turn-helix transcriptional regulator [Flavonifractor sp. An10]|uniref:helix-turn-helix transcriptional regulator n=1 Tax=Flavonifractor sp. An10 TaxID=1965537 RepID=UPI000B3730FA|nr:helix-turn-helix transcriptional regulator [Flavonifractor sp. An10]OUQ83922.1 transcriptional regulator [Flavonifractor sp. An10]